MKRFLVLALLLAFPGAGFGAGPVPDYVLPSGFGDVGAPPPFVASEVELLVREQGGEMEEAWRILGGAGRAAVPAIAAALPRTGWFGRSLLMSALAESGVPEVEPLLTQGTADPSWAVREAAVGGLGHLASPSAAKTIAGLLTDPSWRVRRAAAVALRQDVTRGTWPRDDAIARLLALADDADRDVRFTALRELGELGAEEARERFLTGYLHGDDREKGVCLDALTRMKDARADLLSALETAMDGAEDEPFLTAAEKYAELAGARLLDSPKRRIRLLGYLTNSAGALVPVMKIFEKVGPPAVPVLLEELRKFYRSPGRTPPPHDPSQPILDMVEAILGAKAAPVLEDILLHWEEALPARRYAIVLARRYHASALNATLLSLFPKEGFSDLRAALLEAIEAGAPPDLAQYLKAGILDGNHQVRSTALSILRRHPEIDLSDTIEEAIGKEHRFPGLANDWLNLLAVHDRSRAYAAAVKLLSRPDPEFRARGAIWARVGEDPKAVLEVLTAAYDREDGKNPAEDYDLPEERTRAIRARVVGAILASATVEAGAAALPLLERAAGDADPVVREKAFDNLAKIPGPEALRVILATLEKETDPMPLRAGRRAVVARSGPAAHDYVVGVLSGGDEVARGGILDALRAVPDARIPKIVGAALADGRWSPEARAVAAEALRARKDPSDFDLFVRLAREDPAIDVRTQAVLALGEIRDDRAVDPLLALLPPPGGDLAALSPTEQQLSSLALLSLGELGSPKAVPALLGFLSREWPLALRDPTEDRRHFEAAAQTLAALGRIGDDRAIRPLLDLLFTPTLFRDYGLVGTRPAEGAHSLLGSLVRALVSFPDRDLVPAARKAIAKLVATGDAYRIDEGYLLRLAGIFEEPRRERIARNHPRRGLAAVLRRLVLRVVPRDGDGDAQALDSLADEVANEGDWGRAAELRKRANRITELLDPVGFAKDEAYLKAQEDFFAGLALWAAGKEKEGDARYERGLARDPEDARILNLYAWWRAETGRDLDAALAAALEAGQRSGSPEYIVDTIGWVLHRMGRHEEAAWRLRDAVALDAEHVSQSADFTRRLPDPLLRYHLAAAAAMSGHLDAAADWIRAAVSMDDTFAAAARASPDFEPLRKAGKLEPALAAGLDDS